MAYDKAVDSAQLDAALTEVANAVREKSGTSTALKFPQEMASAIRDISSGEGGELFFAPLTGIPYTPITKDTTTPVGTHSGLLSVQNALGKSDRLVELYTQSSPSGSYALAYCKNLKMVKTGGGKAANLLFYTDLSLQNVTFGGMSDPAAFLGTAVFRDCNHKFYVTVYVDAESLDTIPDAVVQYAPWGAPAASITYRSSVTGEVLS